MKRTMQARGQSGFSLIELLIVVVLLLVMTGTVFQLIHVSLARSGTEQARLDMFQEARQFMDQLTHDLHQAGYPSTQNVTLGSLTATPVSNDSRTAVGLVKIGVGDLWFEGDVDGTGAVYSVKYHLDTSTTNGCPCLRRSQQQKTTGNPLTGQPPAIYVVEVQGVLNPIIFSAYLHGATGTALGLPVDFTTNAATIANVDTIQAVLTIRSTFVDPQTKRRPTTTLVSAVRLNNCSQAAMGQDMSCE